MNCQYVYMSLAYNTRLQIKTLSLFASYQAIPEVKHIKLVRNRLYTLNSYVNILV